MVGSLQIVRRRAENRLMQFSRKTEVRPALDSGGPDAPLDDAGRNLVREHLPIVGYLVSEVLGRVPSHVQRGDLVSAGQLALVKAARAYDPTTGVPFGHYARTRIRGALVDELRASDWASRGVRSKGRQMAQAEDRMASELGRWPTDVELAHELEVEVRSVTTTRGDLHRSVVISLDQLVDLNGSADEHLTADAHQVDAGQFVVQAEKMRYLMAAVQALPDRLRVVVEQYFLGERPMAEIAAELGVTESRVSQLRAEALVLLKDGMNTHLDPERVIEPERPDGVVARRRSAYYAKVAAFAAAPAVPVQRTAEAGTASSAALRFDATRTA
jgi:RNA polymerase sigma factor for flagellar operon FliA